MNEKAKYTIILILAVLVSLATSYLSTLYFHSNSQSTSSNSPQTTQKPTSTQQPTGIKIFLQYNLSFFAGDSSLVTVYSDVTVYNLTIIYNYKPISGGSNVTQSLNYGNYYPSWGSTVVTAGEIPFAILEIPQNIIEACSTTVANSAGNPVFMIRPQLTVTVYGFS
jgi:hypothetical protein